MVTSAASIAMAAPPRSQKIGIVVYPNAMTLDVIGPFEVFAMAANLRKQKKSAGAYEVFLIAETLEPVAMSSGVKMDPDCTFETCPFPLDTLIVPGSDLVDKVMSNKPLLRWLKQHAGHTRRLVSICTGAFFLAELGLLDGMKVTTHWVFSKLLQDRYPELEVQPDSLYIKQGRTYTSAGITAGMDLSLTLVEEDCGKDIAMAVARTLVLFYRRPGGQNQFSDVILSQSSEHFSKLIEWIMQNLREEMTVERLAGQANMSARNFARLFRQELKQTPAKFIEKLRLQNARTLLENRKLSLKEIAVTSGFKTEEQMRRAFRRELSVTPQEYRERFAATGVL
jgi:transcriptional regulator GlxA family with amidase domain